MLNVLDLAEQDTRLHKVSVREMAGPCPNPDCRCKTDGFRVQALRNDWTGSPQGGFMCRGCWDPRHPPIRPHHPRWGDVIDYLMYIKKMSYRQARRFLEVQAGYVSAEPRFAHQQLDDYRSESWQIRVQQCVEEAIERLWSPADPLALNYLRARGFGDYTIRWAHLGYSVQDGIPRLLIPAFNEGQYVAVYRRDLRPDVPKERRWRDMPGSTKCELYLGDSLNRRLPTILTESALDALSLVQTCGDIVNVVATNGVNCSKLPRWRMRLYDMPCVLVAFDADEAGDAGAQWWLERLPNASRLYPQGKDCNDMLREGIDIRKWIVITTNTAGIWTDEEPVDVCWSCQTPITANDRDFAYTAEGVCYCDRHPVVASVPEEPPPAPQAAEGMTYEEFWGIAERIAASIPGGCTMTPNPPGYTLEQYVRDNAEEYERRWEEEFRQCRLRNRARLNDET